MRCPVCDNKFSAIYVKTGKARRLDSDFDLRPRFEHIDTNKYDVITCKNCGYSALNQFFSHITAGQRKLIKEKVCSKYKVVEEGISDTAMDYNKAIERYKLALYNAFAKRGHISEKGYLCLKISWLYRGKIEKLQEIFPICGMNCNTYDSLLAAMACQLGAYDDAMKLAASILSSPSATVPMKDRAIELKDKIVKFKKEKL